MNMIDGANIQTAQQLVTKLAQGDFEAVVQSLDGSIRQQLPAEKLQAAWQSLTAQVGAFKEQVGAHTFLIPSAEYIMVTCAFANANLDINVKFSEAGGIVALNFTPVGSVEQQFSYEPPAYAKQDMFKEQEVQVGQGEWVLPGTLSVPVGDGSFAAVLLVHGSGPNDRDETVGPNKPFRDLAWGLASQGIAVLRYDKRSRVYAEKMQELGLFATMTVKEEVIDDALAAVALLRDSAQVNPQRIVVLGHSLGGYLLPRIEAGDVGIAGLIALAGLCRPFEDGYLDQITYICSLSGTLSAEQQQQLDELKKQVALVKSPGLSLSTPASELPLGIPASYWLDLRGYHPEESARGLPQPMLILQGEGDYQVTMEDFQIWKSALGVRNDVQFKSYPGLYHLFMPFEGGGKATPAAYNVPGHVVEEVITDIVQWVKHI